MMKKKERLQQINIRQQKFQTKIAKGFKITSRRSQVFETSPVSNSFKDDIEEVKEKISGKEGSS